MFCENLWVANYCKLWATQPLDDGLSNGKGVRFKKHSNLQKHVANKLLLTLSNAMESRKTIMHGKNKKNGSRTVGPEKTSGIPKDLTSSFLSTWTLASARAGRTGGASVELIMLA